VVFSEKCRDEKSYTGRSYPAREYVHKITLQDGKTVEGPLAAIVYVRTETEADPERYLLHKRDKGPAGGNLSSLVYVRSIKLGDEALAEGRQKASRSRKQAGVGRSSEPKRD
jgi:hypothetical protein